MPLSLRATLATGGLLCAALVLAAPATAQTAAPSTPVAHETWTIDKTPQDLQPAVHRAEAGIRLVMAGVQNKLMELLSTKGPMAAMDVYRRWVAWMDQYLK